MAQPTNENDNYVRRLSDDIHNFKASHHLPDDLESSMTILRFSLCMISNMCISIVTGAISHLQKQAQEVMRQKPKWQSYFQGQMMSKDDYEFISNFDTLNAEGRAKLLTDSNARHQVIQLSPSKWFVIWFSVQKLFSH